jgi:hypothetical protein
MSQQQNFAHFATQVQTYLRELERGNADAICALFSPNAQIHSPFLGWVQPGPFFEKVIASSGQSKIRPIDICASVTGRPCLTVHFIYDWALKDGSSVNFECVDVFEFGLEGKIDKMVILYDTYPIRATVGDKYA